MDLTADAIVQSQKNVDRMVREDAAAKSAVPAAGATPSGPTYRDFIFSAMHARQDAINRFLAGDMEGGASRTNWLEGQLSNPEVAQMLGAIAVARIPGISEHAANLVSGAWSADVTNARLSGQQKSEGYLKANFGERRGGLMYKVQNGTADAVERNEFYREQSSGVASSTPTFKVDPATGKKVAVGSVPNLERSEATVLGTNATLEGFGVQRYSGTDSKSVNPDWNTLADSTQQTSEALHDIYGDRFYAGRTKTVGLINSWFSPNGKVDPREKVAAFNSLSPVLKKIGELVSASPNDRETVTEFLDNLPADITQEQFKRDVLPALNKFAEYKRYDALVRKNEKYFDRGDPEISLSASYRGAPDTSSLVKHSFRDEDPKQTSVMEQRIELGKRIEERDAEIRRTATAGVSRFPDANGLPKAATRAEQIVARTFEAQAQAIETAKSTGNDQLIEAIIGSSLNKIRSEFDRIGGKEVSANLTDAELVTIARHWLDLDAVQGSTEKAAKAAKSMPSVDETLAKIAEKMKDPTLSQKERNDLSRSDGVLRETKALTSAGRVGLSPKELAEYDAYKSLAPSGMTAAEDRIEVEKGRILSQATKRLFSSEFSSNGVLNISSQDAIIGTKKGSAKAARDAIFSDTGLDALVPDTKTQDRIVMALQGATTEQAAVVLKDILNTVAQPGIVKPRGLWSSVKEGGKSPLSKVELAATVVAAPAMVTVATAGALARMGGRTTAAEGRLELVDPGHRTSFEPPQSLVIAMQARAGISEAREAMKHLPGADVEAKQEAKVSQTYKDVASKLSPAGREWLEANVPGAIMSKDAMLETVLRNAYSAGDTKTLKDVFNVSLDLKKLAEDKRKNAASEANTLLKELSVAEQNASASSYETISKRLSEYGITPPPMSAARPAPAEPSATKKTETTE